jgi:hypothetical protein
LPEDRVASCIITGHARTRMSRHVGRLRPNVQIPFGKEAAARRTRAERAPNARRTRAERAPNARRPRRRRIPISLLCRPPLPRHRGFFLRGPLVKPAPRAARPRLGEVSPNQGPVRRPSAKTPRPWWQATHCLRTPPSLPIRSMDAALAA